MASTASECVVDIATVEGNIAHPDGHAGFSPEERPPECRFRRLASTPNPAYRLVRRLFADALDRVNFRTVGWNLFGRWISPGDRVFLSPNLVTHRRDGESWFDFGGKCTHASVVRVVYDYACIPTGDPLVECGAPIQGCDNERLLADTGLDAFVGWQEDVRLPGADIHSLRGLVTTWSWFSALSERVERSSSDPVPVVLGPDSLLDRLFRGRTAPKVRWGDYVLAATAAFHSVGRRVYEVSRRVFDADVIFSVPKLKTRQMVGQTTAPKGTVGAITRKECLGHYRSGGPEENGDEYPKAALARDLASRWPDCAAAGGTRLVAYAGQDAQQGRPPYPQHGRARHHGRAWKGNDTACRMVLDIARILTLARGDGAMADMPLRRYLALADGLISGKGKGRSAHTPEARAWD